MQKSKSYQQLAERTKDELQECNWLFVLCRPLLKRQATDDLVTESDNKRIRLDDISGETIAQILQIVNDPKKMLGPEV